MLQFYGDLFVQTLTRVIQWEVKCSRISNGSTPLTPSISVEIYSFVGVLGIELTSYGLKNAATKAARIHEQLESRGMHVTYGEMTSMLRELRERIEDDFHSMILISLSGHDAELYAQPERDWGEVVTRFRKVRHDVEECSKCFALGRYASAVFHVMLIAEFGVIEAARLFQAEGDRPGWGCLDRLQRINDKPWKDKSPLEQKHSEFLKSLLPLAIAMKDSWRHKISHADNKVEWMDTDFSPEVAREIITTARGFMRRLSAGLPK